MQKDAEFTTEGRFEDATVTFEDEKEGNKPKHAAVF